jgi:acyl-CoA thioester hydrolase
MEHRFSLRPIYADTDAEGVVYYARYLEWLERGRTEWLRQTGTSVNDFKSQGLVFAVKHLDLTYERPARYDELVEVVSDCTDMHGAVMVFSQSVVFAETQEKVVHGKITLVCLDAVSFRPRRLPKLA